MFNKTIRENIIFQNKNILDDELINLLKECKLNNRINSFKKGLDETISEKGENFSGGERQRIALARAIVKNPDLIIIDEGTSNLDIETEKDILSIIQKKFNDKIILRVTHRNENNKSWIRIKI